MLMKRRAARLARMPTKTFYADDETIKDIEFLKADIHEASFSTIVQMAIHDAAEAKRRAMYRADAERLRDDPVNQAEVQAWLPESEEMAEEAWALMEASEAAYAH